MITFKNGRMMEIPATGVPGTDIIKAAAVTDGRIAVAVTDGGYATAIEAGRTYRPKDLMTRSGKFVRISDSPDRSKGGDFAVAA